MEEPLFGLTENDRNLLRRMLDQARLKPPVLRPEDENGFTHRASDVVVVTVATPIPIRVPAASPTEYDCTVLDVYTNTAEDYSVPIIDREDVAIPTGIYFAVLDRNGNWGVVLGGGGASLEIAIFDLTADLTPGGTATASVVTSNVPTLGVGPITVTDAMGRYRSYSGARGFAIATGDDEWWIVQLDQHPLIWTAVLTSNTHDFAASLGGGTILGSIANQQTITYTSREAKTGFPFSKFMASNPVVNNPYNIIGRIDDILLLCYNSDTDVHIIIDIIPATTRAFHFKFTADRTNGAVSSGATIAAEGYQAILDSRGSIPPTATLRDLYYKTPGAKNGQHGIAVWNFKDAEYNIVACQTQATIVSGTVLASGTSGSISLGTLTGLNGSTPSSSISVTNLFGWTSWTSGDPLIAVWDPQAGQWYPLESERATPIPVQLRISGLNFQISYDGGSSWTTWATGESC